MTDHAVRGVDGFVGDEAGEAELPGGCCMTSPVKPDRRFAVSCIVLSPWVDLADDLVGCRDDRAWYGEKSRNVAFFC